MKIALVLALATLLTRTDAAAPAIPTGRMNQFLQEKSSLEMELTEWKQSAVGQFAKEHGFLPSPTARTADEKDDEEVRRFFLTKLQIEEVQVSNPDAVFSTETPFTMMTEEEFTAFVGASYQRGSGLLTATSSAVEDFSNSTCGSCWAFAAIAALESAVCLAGQPLVPLSEQQVVDCDVTSYGCQGGWPGNALEYIQSAGGVCTEDDYPYVSGENTDRESCERSCTPQDVKIHKVVAVPQSERGLLQAISGRPVAVGVAAGNPTWKQYKGGVVSSCTSTDLDHAVLAVGYGEGSGSSPAFFKIKNSWGEGWGEEGFIRLKRGAGTDSTGTCGIIGPKSVYPEL
ncbi:hypothetical protein BBO99_00009676 [Phytophthora kernoviae]|uniref:Peptidase C1A papain C-terminal domain-containing protein n=1 Tax=Phytophthora kernoviae TaxID=325452 RepID=A0A3R7KEE7_9STRA|nr:hypothetical protein JM18_009266 [Phytophthora kernoviae]RLN20709.1 hypothetical protein BBI17_009717 [Phytophthora kernoviae]RLN72816.1 hypothetical protein BBO99_00009676 [Phytophthora kernoviae]